MTETPINSQKNKILFFAIAVLAVTAAGFGIFGNIYKEIPWLKVQIIGQDAGDAFLTGFWFALGTAGLIPAGIYLKELQFEGNEPG